ncbi:MAG: CRTAC1 family protein [Bryobacteraceae bacterium]|nr:CRTAC1 family protein [Bryobacteraceae bacterium]
MRYLVAALPAVWLLAQSIAPLRPFADARLPFRHASSKTPAKYLIEAMGGGVALLDADGDGRLDLFFVNGAQLPPGTSGQPDKSNPRFWNRLYRNAGDGTFTDVTERAGLRGQGYGQGVAVGDCDNDGRADLFVTALGGNTLYRQQTGGVFEEITAKAGVAGGGWSTSAGFIDFDRDGHLDLFVARYLDWDFSKNKWCGGEGQALRAYCHPNEFPATTHLLYRNLGGCRFADVSKSSGIAKFPGKGLGVAFEDVDRDGWPDIFVANDSAPQQLFRNRHDGTFAEVALASGAAYDDDGKVFAGMGVAWTDYNRDGWPDVAVNALANQGYSLFRNVRGLFDHVSASAGLALATKLHSGWGIGFLDYDNDGWKDLFVAQGHVMDNIELTQPGLHYLEAPMLLRNTGGRFSAVDAFTEPLAGRGTAFGDLNQDGGVDIVVATNDGEPHLFLNSGAKQNWLLIDTVGTKSNRDGIGAAVHIVSASGQEQYAFVSTAGSYLSAHDKRVHFGLGADREVKLLEIRWPSGHLQTWTKLAANQVFVAREKAP